MEMITQDEHDLDTVDPNAESTLHRPIHLRRRRNLLASPLLRLPTELILKVFKHAINFWAGMSPPYDDSASPLTLTAICHQLREVGITFPQLWSTVNFTTPSITELFLERCEYDPHILLATESQSTSRTSNPGWPSMHYLVEDPRWKAVWEMLEGRTFNNLRSLAFEGTPHDFVNRIVGIIRKAPNVSHIDLCNLTHAHRQLPWPPSDPVLPLHPSPP